MIKTTSVLETNEDRKKYYALKPLSLMDINNKSPPQK